MRDAIAQGTFEEFVVEFYSLRGQAVPDMA